MRRMIAVLLGLALAPQAARGQAVSSPGDDTQAVAEAGLYYQLLVSPDSFGRAMKTHRVFTETWAQIGPGGVWGFAYLELRYVSAVAGVYYDLFSFGESAFELGIGAGFEAEQLEDGGIYRRYSRFGGYTLVGSEKNFIELYHERGGSGESWTRLIADMAMGEHFSLGVFGQTEDGYGLRLKISAGPLSAWAAPTFVRGNTFLFGGNLVYERRK